MPELTRCPQCERQLRVPDELLGQDVQCPTCAAIFKPTVGVEENTSAPPRPEALQGSLRAEYDPGQGRRSPDDDFDDDLDRPHQTDHDPLAGLSNDYAIDLGQWLRLARQEYGAVVGPMIGYALVLAVVHLLGGGGLVSLFVYPVLQAGYEVVAIAQLRGKPWRFDDFFAGFHWFSSLLACSLLALSMFLGFMVPSLVVFVVAGISQDASVLAAAGALALVGFAAATYVLLRTMAFTVPLIVDRGCGAVDAMRGSWRLTRGHFWGLFGVYLVLGLMNLGGMLLCFIGVLFTQPFTHLTWMAGYLLIAGERPPREEALAQHSN